MQSGAGEVRGRAAGLAVWGAVFLIAFMVLAWGVDREGIAQPYLDPIAQTRTQDEALHVNSAIHMARDGGWWTPEFLGRLFLFKPPLLIWLTALSIKMLGLSLFSVRLPALVLGAAGVAGVFAWGARAGWAAGALAAGFLLLSPFWQMFSRVCLTDVPAAACAALALAVVAFDPLLLRRRTVLLAGCFIAASLLSKSVAGCLPLAALGLYYVVSRRESRPAAGRLALVFLTAGVGMAPWHVYQACVHPQWFWADYVQVQLLGVGLNSQANAFFARSSAFYVMRAVRMDPFFAVFALAGVVGAMRVRRVRSQPAALLAVCWAVVSAAALVAFWAKHLPYLVFIVPSLCVVGALCGPAVLRRRWVSGVLLGGLFCVKLLPAWPMHPEAPPIAGAAAMRAYYALGRDAELILAEPDDEFYSSTIPLPRVRYCFLDPRGAIARTIPHYAPLGIVLTGEQFLRLPELLPAFEARLREWGAGPRAVGSAIVLRSRDEIGEIIRERPGSDFYLPPKWAAAAGEHVLVQYSSARVFLLSREARMRARPLPAIPARW